MMQKIKGFFSGWTNLFKTNLGHMIFTIVAVFILSATIFGGGGDAAVDEGPGKTTPDVQQSETVDDQQQTTPEQPAETNNKLGDYEVSVISHRLAKDWEGKDIVLIKYAFTNNSDDAAAFDWTFTDLVCQDGIELPGSYVLEVEGYDDTLSYAEIQPGITLEFEKPYELRSTTSQITIELSEIISWSNDKLSFTIDLA